MSKKLPKNKNKSNYDLNKYNKIIIILLVINWLLLNY